MKILFIDTYYPGVLEDFRRAYPNYQKFSYEEYKKKLINISFGTADFYSKAIRKLGHDAEEVIVNDEVLQKKWAKKNGLDTNDGRLISKIQELPYIYKFIGKPRWIQDIAIAQVQKYKPDVVYVQNLSILNPGTLEKIKENCKLLAGQIASPLPGDKYIRKFDLIISSFPHFVSHFRKMGINSEYQKLAFEKGIVKKIGIQKRVYDVTFVGSFTPYHTRGTMMLEKLARKIPLQVWGTGIRFLSPVSPLRQNYHGEAWGLEMYKVFAKSKIVVNRHISTSGLYANNTRMFEATGMGALLITDYKKNLNDIYKIGKEAVAYKNEKDLIKKITYYLKSPKEREKIAKSGQKKTFKEHNYDNRMKELTAMFDKYLKQYVK